MPASRLTSWLPLAAFLGVVFAGLCGLMFVYASDRTGRQLLMDAQPSGKTAAVALATVNYIEDNGAALRFAQVKAMPDSAWRPATGRGVVPVDPAAAAWLRVTLHNPSDETQHGVFVVGDKFQDLVEAWILQEGGWRHERAGEKVAGREKPWWGRSNAFRLELPARGERTVYFRATDYFDTGVAVEWWRSAEALHRAQVRELLAEGLYFGGLLALLTYNLILWFRLRAADIRFYVLYLGAMTVFLGLACALPSEFGWSFGSPWLEALIVFAAAGAGVFLAQFARAFLDLKMRWPWAHRVTRVAAGAMGLLMLGGLTTPWTSYGFWMCLTAIGSVAVHVLLLLIAIRSWRAGVRQARFFVLSFGCLFLGAAPLILNWLYFHSGLLRDAGIRSTMTGSALEMLLLSLAIADRFVQAQRERAAAQQQLIEEAERRRTIQEAYADELEVEVRERTRELEAITADKDRIIMVLGHDLRGPLTGLTQSAEQLAADPAAGGRQHFAEDAAATGRGLLLLIEDLVLWARLRGSGKQVTTCGISALIAPAVAVHRGTAKRGDIALVVNAPDSLRVETDLVPAQTLVRNLLDNAVKHARHRVEVAAMLEAGAVRLSVRDDGPGLPAEVAAWLVDENAAASANGRGLGLRLCSEISRAMGLHLESRPAPGGGAEFSIKLKAAAVPEGVH
jgi:signal transduction histidine kinase